MELNAQDKTAIDKIAKLSQNCRFKNCTHIHETGCAVINAVETGEIDTASYQNYLKMKRENAHFESTKTEKRKKDRDFGKMVKHYKKEIKEHK